MQFVLLSVIALSLSGCYTFQNANEDLKNRMFHVSEMRTLRQGIDAYKNKEYAKALEIFNSLYGAAESASIQRQALYAVAATQLMMAKNPQEFYNAYELWLQWSSALDDSHQFEDPRLLEPFILCRFINESMRTESGYFVDPCKASEPENPCTAKEAQIRQLENQLAALIAEIESLKSQSKTLRKKELEIQALKDKIKALEAIDQKIQKKKTEISSPE